MLAGARVQPCREVLTAVAARLEEPVDVGAMRLVSKVWYAAATDGAVTVRLHKFATGALCIPILLDVKVTKSLNLKSLNQETAQRHGLQCMFVWLPCHTVAFLLPAERNLFLRLLVMKHEEQHVG